MLVAGLSLSFAVAGTAISYMAIVWGFDIGIIRTVSAVLLVFFGVVMLSSQLSAKFSELASKLTRSSNNKVAAFDASGKFGQFFLGMLLGLVWVPCIGPTLGAAISLAIQGESLASSFLTMSLFGIGASLPLLLIAFLSGKALNRNKLANFSNRIKKVLALFLLIIGVGILTGYDKTVETFLLSVTPDWLNDLTTSI